MVTRLNRTHFTTNLFYNTRPFVPKNGWQWYRELLISRDNISMANSNTNYSY
ncbi:hypothetical protein GCM10027428_27310 [Haliea atlantica]